MGTITNMFTCIEMQDIEDSQIAVISNLCYNHATAAIHIGSNGYIFVTIAPSGSKDNWTTQLDYDKQTEQLLHELKLIDEHMIVATATTSCG